MSEYLNNDQRKVTAKRLSEMKAEGIRISMLTAYDFTTAGLLDEAGVDSILIGDSAANVKAGFETTLPITLDQMIYHAASVARAVKRAFVVCDMPFGTYQVSREETLRNAIRIMKETGVDAVKLEGGSHLADTIRTLVQVGIPVVGHLGPTPQSIHAFGNYGVRARAEAEAAQLLRDVEVLTEAGCCAIVLEKIPAALTEKAVKLTHLPIIGIGAGAADGQVLVSDDMLGMNKGFSPKFLRRYADLHDVITKAVGHYVEDVRSGDFPSESECY